MSSPPTMGKGEYTKDKETVPQPERTCQPWKKGEEENPTEEDRIKEKTMKPRASLTRFKTF